MLVLISSSRRSRDVTGRGGEGNPCDVAAFLESSGAMCPDTSALIDMPE
jgi:hypothetical protein